jgi:uncharacterized protein with NAD-binding domain and iron-sulfur cluster
VREMAKQSGIVTHFADLFELPGQRKRQPVLRPPIMKPKLAKNQRHQPALLAQHCAEAGLAEKAVSYWLKAGQQAMDRSAMTEAFAQLRKGLDVLAGAGVWRRAAAQDEPGDNELVQSLRQLCFGQIGDCLY